MTGIEIAVVCAFGWLARKGRRVAVRADGQVDEALDATVDALGEKARDLIANRLGSGDKGLAKLQLEAESGLAEPTAPAIERITAALNAEAVEDPEFAAAVRGLIEEIKQATSGGGTVIRVEHGVGQQIVHGSGTAVGNVERDLVIHPPGPGWTQG